jgi:hypothetical protein
MKSIWKERKERNMTVEDLERILRKFNPTAPVEFEFFDSDGHQRMAQFIAIEATFHGPSVLFRLEQDENWPSS